MTESKESPKHVAGLQIFRKPAKAPANWVRHLAKEYASYQQVRPPFNRVIDFRALGGPRWREVEALDINEHLFYHRPPRGLSESALFDMCARLHEPLMDRSKPMWEWHVIDNVQGGRFAIYSKIHHAYADGITMSRWNIESLNTTSRVRKLKVIWAREEAGVDREEAKSRRALFGRILRSTRDWRLILGGTTKLTTQLALEQVGLTRNAVALPFKAVEETPLTGAVTAGRQFATAHVSMDRIKKLRAMTRCTLNHIALTCLDGALRRYLADAGIELKRPLSIQMPVNLRDENDRVSGNKIGIVLVDLAPSTSDPTAACGKSGLRCAVCVTRSMACLR
ncbi:MAG: wax ester/triacylglycerol synthase domain-containing protein [Pseudomonadota bacterium]